MNKYIIQNPAYAEQSHSLVKDFFFFNQSFKLLTPNVTMLYFFWQFSSSRILQNVLWLLQPAMPDFAAAIFQNLQSNLSFFYCSYFS